MRPIKFMAWDKINKIMLYDFSITSKGQIKDIIYPFHLIPEGLTITNEEDYILMQYKEENDHFSVRVCDGDILDFGSKGIFYVKR